MGKSANGQKTLPLLEAPRLLPSNERPLRQVRLGTIFPPPLRQWKTLAYHHVTLRLLSGQMRQTLEVSLNQPHP